MWRKWMMVCWKNELSKKEKEVWFVEEPTNNERMIVETKIEWSSNEGGKEEVWWQKN